MDLSGVYIHRPAWHTLIVLFALAWPFLAFAYLRRGTRSAAPLMAMLLPVVVASCGTWLGLQQVLHGMAVSGSGGELWVRLGIAEAFAVLRVGVYSAVGVAMVALIRRHRVALDRGTIIVATLIAAELLVAAVLSRDFVPAWRTFYFVRAGAIAACTIAVAAAVRFFLVARRAH